MQFINQGNGIPFLLRVKSVIVHFRQVVIYVDI